MKNMKNMKKIFTVLFLFLSAITVNLFACTDVYASNQSKLEKYYKEVLVPKYGKFKKKQTGTMREVSDDWMNCFSGIMSTYIADYDGDGKKEMMACIAEKGSEPKSSTVYIHMYEVKNGKVEEAAKVGAASYSEYIQDDLSGGFTLQKCEWTDETFILNTIKRKNKLYLVFQEIVTTSVFANGYGENHWIMEYKNNKFQFVASFSQTSGGSCDFSYTVYQFKKGKANNGVLYYADGDYFLLRPEKKSKYKTFSSALKSFYKKYGITVEKKNITASNSKNFKSVISSKNNILQQTKFINKCTKRDYNTRNYKFKASLSVKNK